MKNETDNKERKLFVLRDSEKKNVSALHLNPALDDVVPQWVINLIQRRGISSKNKLLTILAHNRRICVYQMHGKHLKNTIAKEINNEKNK